MEHAVILAAGRGSRLSPLTDSVPKCCIRVAGQTLVSRIVDQLLTSVREVQISIAVGYLADRVRDEVAAYEKRVAIIENVDFSSTNNMESCRRVLEQIHVEDDLYIINGDCIYDLSVIERMASAHSSCIAVDSSKYLEESMKVRVVEGLARDISKTLPDRPDCFTSIDFYKFSCSDAKKLHNIMQDYYLRSDLGQWTEVAIRDLLEAASTAVSVVDVQGSPWVEIDNYDDLSSAARLFGAK